MWFSKNNLKKLWQGFRTLIGEDAYEQYLERHHIRHSQEPVLSHKEFYKQETERKWNGIKRCC